MSLHLFLDQKKNNHDCFHDIYLLNSLTLSLLLATMRTNVEKKEQIKTKYVDSKNCFLF